MQYQSTREIIVLQRESNSEGISTFISNEVGIYPLLPLIESYLGHYAATNNKTAKAKRNDMRTFSEYLFENYGDVPVLNDFTYSTAVSYVESRLDIEAPSTVTRRIATLKHFASRLADIVPGFINPMREVRSPVFTQLNFKAMTNDDIKRFYDVIRNSGDSFREVRNATICQTLLETGIRNDEIKGLTIGQYAGRWFEAVKCKGRKYRNVPISEELGNTIDRYLVRRRELKQSPTSPLFPSVYRGAVRFADNKTIHRIVNSFGVRAGVDWLHPHALRHTFAYVVGKQLKDPRLIAQLLGHSSINTSMIYTSRNDKDLLAAVNNFSVLADGR